MNPHDHDPDLIMAIAAGAQVSDADRAAIGACTDCATDLAAQQVALGALRAAPPAAVTELESARLLRRLDAELGHKRTPAAVRSAPTRRRFSWAPAFSIAAVILALVLIAPAMNLLGGGDDEGTEDMLAFSVPTTTVVGLGAAESAAPEAQRQAAAPETATADATVSPTTLAPAAEDETATAADAAGDGDVPPTLTELRSIIEDAGVEPETARLGVASIADLSASEPADACVLEGVAEVGGVVSSYTLGDLAVTPEPGVGDATPLPLPVTVTVHERDDGSIALVAHDPPSCEPVATLR